MLRTRPTSSSGASERRPAERSQPGPRLGRLLGGDQMVLYALCVLLLAVVALRLVGVGQGGGGEVRKLKPGQRPVYRVDVNAADVRELELLPGIGPAKASRIVEYRRAHGPFDSLDDLRRVPGVGPSIVRDINGLATAERAASEGDDTR